MYEPINGWMLLVLYIVDNLLHFKEICTRMPRVRHTHTLLLSLYNLSRLSTICIYVLEYATAHFRGRYLSEHTAVLSGGTHRGGNQTHLGRDTLVRTFHPEKFRMHLQSVSWESCRLHEVDTKSEAPSMPR